MLRTTYATNLKSFGFFHFHTVVSTIVILYLLILMTKYILEYYYILCMCKKSFILKLILI